MRFYRRLVYLELALDREKTMKKVSYLQTVASIGSISVVADSSVLTVKIVKAAIAVPLI